jgi:hypothetical protein
VDAQFPKTPAEGGPDLRTGRLSARVWLFLAVLAYTAVFYLSYRWLVVPIYEFWGLSNPAVPWPYLAVSWVLALLPALWIPTDLRRPSQLLFLLVYLVLFIPATFILYASTNPILPPAEAFRLILLLFAGLGIISLVYFLPLVRLPRPSVPPRVIWLVIGLAAAGLSAYLLVTQRNQIRLANLEQIYELRREMAEQVIHSGTALGFYAVTWLAGFIFPFLFAVGWFRRRWWLCGAGLAGEFFLFTVGGFKMTLLAVAYLPLMALLLRRFEKMFSGALAHGMTLLLLTGFLPLGSWLPQFRAWIVGVLHFRIFSMPALLIAQYYDFFQHHPLTFLSHVTGVNRIIDYPYPVDIPRTVGFQYYGDPNLGSNASFWAADGLAGFGWPGILIVSLLAAAVFWLFDSCARDHDRRPAALAATVIGVSLANVSLFTTLWSGGFIFLMLSLWLLPGQSTGGGPAEEWEAA